MQPGLGGRPDSRACRRRKRIRRIRPLTENVSGNPLYENDPIVREDLTPYNRELVLSLIQCRSFTKCWIGVNLQKGNLL